MNIVATGMGWIDHTPGGLNRYFADYLQAMTGLGHSVRGFMHAGGEHTTAPSYIGDVLGKPEKLGTFARSRAFRCAFRQEIKRETPDVYNPHFALYASLITRNLLPRSVPFVTHFHGPWAQESRVEDEGGGAHKLKQAALYQAKKSIEQFSYRRSDHFIVLSQYFKDILRDDYGVADSNIHIIPGGVQSERFKPAADRAQARASLGLQQEQKVLFCARRLVQRMGIDQLIRAMEKAVKEQPDIVLYIAGNGAMRLELEQLVDKLGLRSFVCLLGRISNEDLVRWYQAADLSIVPTRTLEGFGLVTVESLACGTPVLGTPYGGTKEILEQLSENLLFRDGSPEAIAEKIVSVVSGETPIPSRQACYDHVLEHYTWERAARSVTSVFEQAIEERRELKPAGFLAVKRGNG